MVTEQRARPEPRTAYRYFRAISPQWRDNDVFGHVNNAVHYTWFDSTVNGWLLERGLLTGGSSGNVGLVVANSCQYFGEVAFPADVACGLRCGRVGQTSVKYELGLFRDGASQSFAAGTLAHVYVDLPSREPAVLSRHMPLVLNDLTVQ